MNDRKRTKAELIRELTTLRQQVTALEQANVALQQINAGLYQSQDVLQHQLESLGERKAAEGEREELLAQLENMEREQLAILNTAPSGIILMDQQHQVLLANSVGAQYLAVLAHAGVGNQLERLGDRPVTEILTAPPARGLWHEIVAGKRTFEAIARPIANGPETERWVIVVRDVTEQREIMRRSQQQEQLVLVGQLAAGIAHDFNNILSVIMLDTDLMLLAQPADEKMRRRLETIAEQTRRASALIQQILDFGRRSIMARRQLPLLPFLKEQIMLLERTLPENIQLALVDEGSFPMIEADPTRIQQAIMNLVINARDAMPAGGLIRLHLSMIDVTGEEDAPLPGLGPGRWVRLAVSDTGTGITDAVKLHLFEPFFTTKAPGEGTGLGLAQLQGIVEQHGGEIDVETEVGKGTTFSLYFPAAAATERESEVLAPPTPVSQGQLILLVEDDNSLRQTTLEALQALRYHVVTARNGLEAMAILQERATDVSLVLSDVVMPGMGGQALFYAIQAQNLPIPVVLMTGHPLGEESEELHQRGLVASIQKPVNFNQLAEVLYAVLYGNKN
jgi:signal transduction histidine kinase/ActR/RegA family two-component response regulator